jgi:hypothetical protein
MLFDGRPEELAALGEIRAPSVADCSFHDAAGWHGAVTVVASKEAANNMLWLIRREVWKTARSGSHRWSLPRPRHRHVRRRPRGTVSMGWQSSGIDIWRIGNIRNGCRKSRTEADDLRHHAVQFTAILLFTMIIVLFFYLHDSLLAERKDRSILFWKSCRCRTPRSSCQAAHRGVVVVRVRPGRKLGSPDPVRTGLVSPVQRYVSR